MLNDLFVTHMCLFYLSAKRCPECMVSSLGRLKRHMRSRTCDLAHTTRRFLVGLGFNDPDTSYGRTHRDRYRRCPICYDAVQRLDQHLGLVSFP